MGPVLSPSIDIQAAAQLSSRSKLDRFKRANQYGVYFPFHLFFGPWYGNITVLPTSTEMLSGYSYVIASNHQSRIDPFMIMGAIPLRFWPKISTVHFMTANIFFTFLPLRLFLEGFGCFPAKQRGNSLFGLGFARSVLKRHESVFIFPEGRRTQSGLLPAKHGVEELARIDKTLILPVHVKWNVKGLFRRSVDITIGKPFDGSSMSAQGILDACYALPLR